MMKRLLIVMAVICLCFAGTSHAQTAGNGQYMDITNTTTLGGWFDNLRLKGDNIFLLEQENSQEFVFWSADNQMGVTLDFKTSSSLSPYWWMIKNDPQDPAVRTDKFDHKSSAQQFDFVWNTPSSGFKTVFLDMDLTNGGRTNIGYITVHLARLPVAKAPTGLTTTRTGDGTSVNLSWNLPEPEFTGSVQVQRLSGSSWVTETTLSGAATSTSLSGQPIGQVDYRVRAVNPSGNSSWTTKTLSALSVPGTPGSVSVSRTSSGKSATVTWSLNGLVSKAQVQHRVSGTSTWTTTNVTSAATSKTISGLRYDTGYQFRVRLGNSAGYGSWSSTKTLSSVALNAATNAKMINPYTYVLTWSDPNPAYFNGTIYIEGSTSPGNYYYYATITDFHATSHVLGFNFPNRDFRIRWVDEYGRSAVSNVAEGKFHAVTDLEVFRPYYYNLRWTDPNPEVVTGKIEVQRNYYMGSSTSYYTVGTIYDIHATSYYIGPSFSCGLLYRLKMTNYEDGSVLYSHISTTNLVCRDEEDGFTDASLPTDHVRLYPSPVQGQLFMQTDMLLGDEYQIVDVRGVVVQRGALGGELLRGEQAIPVYDLQDGVYFLMADDAMLGKFIKQ